MQIGDVAEGIIQSIKPYGAFVDLGKGMSGLLHISQISYDRITNVGSILSEGDKLKVCVETSMASIHCTCNAHVVGTLCFVSASHRAVSMLILLSRQMICLWPSHQLSLHR